MIYHGNIVHSVEFTTVLPESPDSTSSPSPTPYLPEGKETFFIIQRLSAP